MNWIKCSDKMPPIGTDVMVISGKHEYVDTCWDGEGWAHYNCEPEDESFDCNELYSNVNITHWCEYPDQFTKVSY
jgi:hypothetical protein